MSLREIQKKYSTKIRRESSDWVKLQAQLPVTLGLPSLCSALWKLLETLKLTISLLADAAHLSSDVASFCVFVLLCGRQGGRQLLVTPTGSLEMKFWAHWASILLIWLLIGILVYEAICRLINHTAHEVKGYLMFIVAAIGLGVNIVMAVVLCHNHSRGHSNDNRDSTREANNTEVVNSEKRHWNISVQGVYLHVIGDSIQSIGAMIA
ncbi:hypothetical protein IFM89_031612 [Coptis chinensis]|uniref:Cation efflux protein transmembrane domain-containing protein n=1 Tax=Coptis chinensis TaxID=261450 RepID=A0A835H805_9MAGN|nr:hypothetical protein IFM89_031612 [Coptis chinensis]